jgi:hypothetical protein
VLNRSEVTVEPYFPNEAAGDTETGCDPTRRQWAADFTRRAEAHWTPDQKRRVFGRKKLTLPPDTCGPLLRALGLCKRDASMGPHQIRKYMQICHVAALLEPLLCEQMKTRRPVRLLDVGCGRSYLTLLLGWCFAHKWRHPVEILGVDRREKLICASQRRVSAVGVDGAVKFFPAAVETLHADRMAEIWSTVFGQKQQPHTGQSTDFALDGLFALHACDTASCNALALGVALDVPLIGVAPCCQAELARAWAARVDDVTVADEPFAPVMRSPHLRREVGAVMTDVLRTLLLRGCGYTVTAMEFVSTDHTPKNTLLRATRRAGADPSADANDDGWDDSARAAFGQYLRLRRVLGGVSIALEQRLPAHHRKRLRKMEKRDSFGVEQSGSPAETECPV